MNTRFNAFSVHPEAMAALLALTKQVDALGFEPGLPELVKVRASQLNGCAVCIQMHWSAARAGGESEQRLSLLNAWREAPVFSDRERAALAWTEALTMLPTCGGTDREYAQLQANFTLHEQAQLTMVISLINAWNRLMVGSGSVAGIKTR